MAGLFSLGTGNNNTTTEEDQQHNPPTQIPPPPPPTHHHPDSLFWYQKNDDVVSSYRGFELWNQHHHQQQQQFFPQAQPQPQPRSLFQHQDLYSSAAALGVGPSRLSDDNPLPSRSGFMMMSGSGSGSGSGGISCQDCGNQAKKDCPHIRCRTCCKSRGFDCQTHLKSTWVPAAKRRERQQQLAAGLKKQQQRPDDEGEETEEDEDIVPQRHRDQLIQTSLACTRLPTNPTSLTAGGLEEEVNFPAMVSSPAEFRCVRVSSVDESESEEYAYSTEVNIGGHVFRGILYDYGPDNNYMPPTTGNTCSSTLEGAVQQPLNLISTPIATTTTVVGAIVDPSSFYPAPLNTFMPPSGTQFFPHPRS